MPDRVVLCIGTKKGLFVATASKNRRRFDLRGPFGAGVAVNAAPAGLFLNPAAYSAPAPGQWGDAGRDSITGPAQFSLNASIGRTFRLGSRLDGTWRMDAFNVLNTVTYTSYNTVVTSPLFGVPNQANTMRKLQMSFRVRF